MKHLARRLGVVSFFATSGLVGAIGCSGGSQEQTGSTSSGGSEEALTASDTFITPHYMPVTRNGAKPKATAQVGASASDLTYRGGPLIQAGKIHTVFWGTNVANQDKLGQFFQSVGQSGYLDWLSEYSTNGMNIGRATFGSKVVDTTAQQTGTVTNKAIGQELERLIANGTAPAPDNDTLYMIYFPPGLSIDLDGQGTSCVQFCAYHYTYTRANGQNVYYGVMPDLGGACAGGCGNQPTVFDNLTEVSSHEWIEATTDPAVGINVLSWYNDSQGEIGDICNGQAGTVNGYGVQKEWSNKNGKCIVTDPGGGGSSSSSGGSSSSSGGSSSGGSSSSSGGSSSSSGGSSSGGGGGCVAESEPNDGPTNADALATSICGDLSPAGDRDDATFSLTGSTAYDIVLAPTGDATLKLYKQTGSNKWTRVANTSPTEVKHTSSGGGKYLVTVSSPSRATQSYTLTRN